jgi:hypothetical protein
MSEGTMIKDATEALKAVEAVRAWTITKLPQKRENFIAHSSLISGRVDGWPHGAEPR